MALEPSTFRQQQRHGLKSNQGRNLQFSNIRYKFPTEEITDAQNFNPPPPKFSQNVFCTCG